MGIEYRMNERRVMALAMAALALQVTGDLALTEAQLGDLLEEFERALETGHPGPIMNRIAELALSVGLIK